MSDKQGPRINPGTTVVGGRQKRGLKRSIAVPVGIEKILYLASEDDAFRRRLLDDRQAALADAGIRLKESERMMLSFMDDGELLMMVDNIKPPKPHRRKFMNAVAAAAVTLTAGTLLQACTGIRPEDDIVDKKETAAVKDTIEVKETFTYGDEGITPEDVKINDTFEYATQGIMPDAGVDMIEVEQELPAPTGILPDVVDMEADWAQSLGITPDTE